MKHHILTTLFLSLILVVACKDKTTTQPTAAMPEETVKDISELTYLEIYQVLFTDNHGGFDAHGDLYGQEAVSELIIEKDADTDCGETLILTSNSQEKEITLAVRASFNFPGNPNNEMLRAYNIKPAERISIGNSKLCYNGKVYDITREIVSAGFKNGTSDQ